MRQTEAFSLAEQSCKLLVFFVEIKERIKIAVIVCLEVIADLARMSLLINPLADRSLTALFVEGCLLHPLEHRGFSRCKQIHLCGKLLVQFFQMGG